MYYYDCSMVEFIMECKEGQVFDLDLCAAFSLYKQHWNDLNSNATFDYQIRNELMLAFYTILISSGVNSL